MKKPYYVIKLWRKNSGTIYFRKKLVHYFIYTSDLKKAKRFRTALKAEEFSKLIVLNKYRINVKKILSVKKK